MRKKQFGKLMIILVISLILMSLMILIKNRLILKAIFENICFEGAIRKTAFEIWFFEEAIFKKYFWNVSFFFFFEKAILNCSFCRSNFENVLLEGRLIKTYFIGEQFQKSVLDNEFLGRAILEVAILKKYFWKCFFQE